MNSYSSFFPHCFLLKTENGENTILLILFGSRKSSKGCLGKPYLIVRANPANLYLVSLLRRKIGKVTLSDFVLYLTRFDKYSIEISIVSAGTWLTCPTNLCTMIRQVKHFQTEIAKGSFGSRLLDQFRFNDCFFFLTSAPHQGSQQKI